MTLINIKKPMVEAVPGFDRLRVKALIAETADASSIVFEVPETLQDDFRYLPGQFLTLRAEVNGEIVLRNYSLASAPVTGENLKVTIKRVPGGRMSNWLLDNLNAGDEMLVMPPKGVFCLQESDAPVGLFAAGSGITPVISILKQVLLASQRKVKLVYANRNRDSIIFREELARLSDMYGDRFELVHHLDVEHGYLTTESVGRAVADRLSEFYLCGPGAFMNTVKEGLAVHGVPENQVFMESFDAASDDEQAPDPDALSEGTGSEVVIRFRGEEHPIFVVQGETIHAAAARQGLNLPFSCKAAFCGLCVARVASGKVHLKENLGGISDAQIAEGMTLTCQALVETPCATVEVE